MPLQPVVEALVEVYFHRMHWFIFIFHQPSFLERAHRVLSTPTWKRQDLGDVYVTLMVAALGLRCAAQDITWLGNELLAKSSLDPQLIVEELISEIRMQLLELLDDCCIETVQTCSLLGTFYIYYGSPSLAWSMIGLSVRTAYALALHCDGPLEGD